MFTHIAICNNSGTIAIYNYDKKIFISPCLDGPLKFSNNPITNNENIKVITKYGKSFSIVRVPYAFKLLMQELQTMNIQMRIITEDNIDQLTSMNSEKTNNILKDLYLNEKTELQETKVDQKNVNKELMTISNIKPDESDLDNDDDDDLHPITRESVKKAEDSYNEYKELEDDNISDDGEENKPAISIGEQIQTALTNVVDLITGNNKEESSEKTPEQKEEVTLAGGNNIIENEELTNEHLDGGQELNHEDEQNISSETKTVQFQS